MTATDPLLGRDDELARLCDLLDGAPDQGGTLVLRGEAGVGKSALLAAAVMEAATRGLRVLSVTAFQAEFHVPFVGIDMVLRQLTGVPAVSEEDSPYQAALTVLRLLTAAAGDQPLVLVVEDAQWLDGPSWEALAFVGRRLNADPVLLLLAMRDGEETDARLALAGLPELRVEPLGEAQAVALLAHQAPDLQPDLRARVLAGAAGNPLGLVELATVADRFGEDALLPAWLPLTTRLEQTFGVQVGELPPTTRSLLLVAALNDGDGLDEILLAGSLVAGGPVTPDVLEPAVSARLLEIGGAYRVRFRHPLMRSSIRQAATLDQRRKAHAALAEVLTDRYRRVWHRAAATIGTDEEVAVELVAAADWAQRRGAAAAAVTALERAAHLSADATGRATRLLSAAQTAHDVGDHKTLERLVHAIAEHDLPPADRAGLQWLQEVLIGGWSGASRVVAHAGIAERMHLDGNTARALQTLATVSLRCWWSNPDPQSREAIISVAERLHVEPLDPRLVYVLALAAPIERGAVALDRMSQLMARVDLDSEHLHLLGTAATGSGAPGMANVFLAAAGAGLREQGKFGLLAQNLVSQAWAAVQLGDTVLGRTAAAEGRSLAAETGHARWILTADLMQSHVEALRGNGETARALADQGERLLLQAGAHPMLAMVQQARGIDALAGGRYAEAHDHLSRIFDAADTAYHAYVRFSVLGHLAEAGTRCDRHDDVRRVVGELEPIAAATRSPALEVGLAYARALLASDDAAEALFRSGLGGDLASWPFERSRLQLAYGAWLRRRRRPAESRPLLRAAIAAFDALGVAPWAERARQELRASGETVRRTEDSRDRLTPQEWQIAQLAAEGLTNREIAGRLFLSPRTVSTHLYRIYPKVGVSSRAELAHIMLAVSAEVPTDV